MPGGGLIRALFLGLVIDRFDHVLYQIDGLPREQIATARHVLADALKGDYEAHCPGGYNDHEGIFVRTSGGTYFVRYAEEKGLEISFIGTLRGGILTETSYGERGGMHMPGDIRTTLSYVHPRGTIVVEGGPDESSRKRMHALRELLREWSSEHPSTT